MLGMISVIKATERDYNSIASIGKISIAESHRDSCSAEDMNEFLERNYNSDAIKEELNNINNIYHIINYNDKPVGFSKIILNAKHPNIVTENVTKLDRIYLLKEFYGLKLGLELLNFNIELSRNNNQSGIWLYTWIGNNREQGKVKKIKIVSTNGLPCHILLPGNVNIKDQQGKTIAYQNNEDVIVFDTKKNTRYSITVN